MPFPKAPLPQSTALWLVDVLPAGFQKVPSPLPDLSTMPPNHRTHCIEKCLWNSTT